MSRCEDVKPPQARREVAAGAKTAGEAEPLSLRSSPLDEGGVSWRPNSGDSPEKTLVDDASFARWRPQEYSPVPHIVGEESSLHHLPRGMFNSEACTQAGSSTTVTRRHFT